jgi:hypothetical protein
MADPATIIAIIASLGALGVSLLTHIKMSSCFGLKLETRAPSIIQNYGATQAPG